MLSMLLAAMALGAGLAGGARARVLGYEGTLTIDFIQSSLGTVAFTGMGVATVNGSAGRVPLGSLRLGSGVSGAVTSVPFSDPDLAPLRALGPVVTLATGVLSPISGGGSPLSQNQLPIGGDLRICIVFPDCVSYIPVPLTVGGTRGAGIGGLVTVNTFGTAGLKLSVAGAPWTIGTTTISNSVRSGFAHGPASGTTTTAKEGGVVQLVTPVRVTTSLDFDLDFIGILRVVLVPEPGTGLLLGAGVIALAAMGRRRARRGPD
jgi:hypothetical protein